MDSNTHTLRWVFAAAMLAILLVAAGLRLYRLPELPVGLHFDEAANGVIAGEIARSGYTPVFIPSYTGKEVLFFYWAALWMKLLGTTRLALRLSAALAGLATVAATVWAVRELLQGQRNAKWVALLTAAFLATSFWHLVLSRYGFRAVTQPLMQALTVGALWRGLRISEESAEGRERKKSRRGTPWLLLAGACCGLTAYTYLAARAFPIPLAAALAVLFIADRGRRHARLGQVALFVVTAALMLAPLAYYWLTHPGSFMTRTEQVAAASWAEAWEGMRACLAMFFLRGDPYIRFNLPHRPLFDPITAVLFLIGIIATAAKSKIQNPEPKIASPSRIFLLTYLPIMLLPSALATGEITPSNLRTAGLLPFIYIFPALGLEAVASRILRQSSVVSRQSSVVIVHWSLVILLLVVLAPFTAIAYFRDWAPSSALYRAADGDLVDVASYLNQADLANTTPYVASNHYHHPTLAFLAEDYGRVRSIRGGRTVVFPAEGEGLLIFPHSTSKHLDWVESVLPEGALAAAPPGPDGAPAFHAYRSSPAGEAAPTHPLHADLGHVALVLGYDVIGEPRSGEEAEVGVWWRVLSEPDQRDYEPAIRLVDAWGFAWGEKQMFHYPSEKWTPGEVIVDRIPVPVGPGAPPGDYQVRFGLYSPSADATLPVLDENERYAGREVELALRLVRAEGAPDPDKLGIRDWLDARLGGLTLLGFNLDTKRARPGEPLFLTLFWRAEEAPLPDYGVRLALGETRLYEGAPVHGTYPTTEWMAGEIVADRYGLRLPVDAPAGERPLRLRVTDRGTGAAVCPSLNLGSVQVEATERAFEVPPIAHPLTATLDGQVELLGYDLSTPIPGPSPHNGEGRPAITPGETLTLTLYWRALAEMEESYTVFTHLVGPDGTLSGQQDNPPVGGTYPTNLWLAGEVVADVYEIEVNTDATPGAHRLEVGMYVAETGTRLSVDGTDEDAVAAQTVVVTEP